MMINMISDTNSHPSVLIEVDSGPFHHDLLACPYLPRLRRAVSSEFCHLEKQTEEREISPPVALDDFHDPFHGPPQRRPSTVTVTRSGRGPSSTGFVLDCSDHRVLSSTPGQGPLRRGCSLIGPSDPTHVTSSQVRVKPRFPKFWPRGRSVCCLYLPWASSQVSLSASEVQRFLLRVYRTRARSRTRLQWIESEVLNDSNCRSAKTTGWLQTVFATARRRVRTISEFLGAVQAGRRGRAYKCFTVVSAAGPDSDSYFNGHGTRGTRCAVTRQECHRVGGRAALPRLLEKLQRHMPRGRRSV
eukprot:764898-Hanusia_phi.AAC.15